MADRKKSEFLGTMPIWRLLVKLGVPAFLGLLATAVYNFTDALYVSRGVGSEGMAAISLVFPIVLIVVGVAQMVGVGAASIASRALGADDPGRASNALGTAIVLGVAVALFFSLTLSLFLEQTVELIGGRGALYEPTFEYLRIIAISMFFAVVNLCLTTMIRSEGQVKTATLYMLVGVVLNMILDPIAIFVLDMGIVGAATATAVSRFVTTVLVAGYYLKKRGSIELNRGNLRPRWPMVWETLSIGFPILLRSLANAVFISIRNNAFVTLGGVAVMASMGISQRLVGMLVLPAIGLAGSVPPIVGFNYGAGAVDRVRRVTWAGILSAVGVLTIGGIVLFSVPGALYAIFTSDSALIQTGKPLLRIISFQLPTIGIYFVGSAFYQAIGRPGMSLFMSMTRPVLLVAGVLLAIPLGVHPVVAADPIATAVAGAIVIAFLIRSFRRDPRLAAQEKVRNE